MKLKILILITAVVLFSGCRNKQVKSDNDLRQKSCCMASEKKSCCAASEKKTCNATSVSTSQTGVQVIYFHNERRCATCMAVEEGAQSVVSELKDSSITFNSYLIRDPKSAEVEKKYEIDGQTLLIVGKDQLLNVTNMAFLYARVKPETYREELKKQILKLK